MSNKRKKPDTKKEEGFSQAAHMAAMEKRLPGGKKTKRLPVLKLELGEGAPLDQMQIVSEKLYGLGVGLVGVGSAGETSWPNIGRVLVQ